MRFLDWLLRPLSPMLLGLGEEENEDPAGTGGGEATPTDENEGRRAALESAFAEPASGDDAGSGEKKEEPEPIEPPSHWDPEARERFRATDREWQEWLVQRDQAIDQQQNEIQQQWQPIAQALGPWQGYMQRVGVDAASALNFFMPYEQALRTGNPQQQRNALADLANRYGVTFEKPADDGDKRKRDPLGFQRQIESSIAPVLQSQQELANHVRQMSQDRANRDTEQARARLVAFRDAKDEKGKLLHPYYDELMEDMYDVAEQIKRRGGQPDPVDVYNRAARLNEKVWKKIQADQQAAEKTKKKQAKKDANATGGLAGSGGGGSARAKSRRELLTEGLAEQRRAS